jgi:hypothetical protein
MAASRRLLVASVTQVLPVPLAVARSGDLVVSSVQQEGLRPHVVKIETPGPQGISGDVSGEPANALSERHVEHRGEALADARMLREGVPSGQMMCGSVPA